MATTLRDKLSRPGSLWPGEMPARPAAEMALHALPPARQAEASAGLWALFEQQTRRKLMGDSSSLPLEHAQALLNSVLYTLGIALLPATPGPEAAGEHLLAEGFGAVFAAGQQRLKGMVASGRRLWRAAANLPAPVPHLYLKEMLNSSPKSGGLAGFYAIYDLWYGAAERLELHDYPLHTMPQAYEGIQYLLRYLETLLLELRFLRHFAPGPLHAALRAAQPDYALLPVGLFGPALDCALGCVLTGAPAAGLTPAGMPRAAGKPQIRRAATALCAELGIPREDPLHKAISRAAEESAARLMAAQ